MAKAYVFFNSLAGNGASFDEVKAELCKTVSDQEVFCDVNDGYRDVISSLDADDYLVICGGDGTLNRFINEIDGMEFDNDVLYFASGNGNDFARDIGKENREAPYSIKEHICDLPVVTVNGKSYRFLNGVGYGIDGYCCQVGDELKKIPGKKVDYTAIAIKGLLFHYKPANARVVIDGVENHYRKVWIAPTMHGRFYGGGMMPTPAQDRTQRGKLSIMIWHGSGKLRTLMAFPSLFKGEHLKHTKYIDVCEGSEITVEFDRPTALQIDGETVLGVTSYTARARVLAEMK